jgi:hypothetical protein
MNWEAIGAVGEIGGAIAVVATLLVLYRQIRATSKQLTLSSSTDANSLFNDAFQPIYNNEHNLRIWTTGLRDPASLCEDDLEVYILFMSRLMAVFDTIVELYEHETIPKERFQNYVDFIKQFLEAEGGKVWISRNQYNFSANSKRHIGKSLERADA